MAAETTVLCEESAAAIDASRCRRRQPDGKVGGGQRLDRGGHGRMADAAIFGAEDVVGAGFAGDEPDIAGKSRHGVAFDPEGGDVEGVEDIPGDELDPHRLADGDVEAVAGFAVGIDEGPRPHARFGGDGQGPGRNVAQGEVAGPAVVEHPQHQQRRDDGPDQFEPEIGGDLRGRLRIAAAMVADDEPDHGHGNAEEKDQGDAEIGHEDRVDGVAGRGDEVRVHRRPVSGKGRRKR